MTLLDAYKDFMLSRKLADLSKKTLECYASFVQPFVVYLGSDMDVSVITQNDINGYIESVLSKPITRNSKATYIRHVKIFLRYIQKHHAVKYDANLIRVPKTSRREARIYTEEDIKCIFAVVQAENYWLTIRNRAIISLMLDSGIRQSEVCSIQRKNIVFKDNHLIVRGKGDKERTVPMGNYTRDYIKEYLKVCPYDSEYLFVTRRGKNLTGNAVKLFVNKLAKKLPFEFSSHKLRHNFATNYCIDQYDKFGQVDIFRLMYLMGHEDVETTQRYLHFAYEVIASRGCISHVDKAMCS